ncbi:MAG: YafY family transcriptional regulator [Actinomycetia bacterium]|nr:YafY family transcriptional regulator [Actinomycetes bacterium]
MNRTDRLYAIREELRRAGPRGRTAERLADGFEVSVRTIKRDIATLQAGGFPVWARPGPGGGYVVDAAATLPPVDLTPSEVSGLAVALANQAGQPFAAHARTAFAKILAVAVPADRERAERLAGRVWIDHPCQEPAIDPGVRGVVEEGLASRRVVALTYVDERQTETQRRVDPQMLAHGFGHWYLVAYCHRRQAIRWFRLDRIRSAHLTKQDSRDRPLADIGVPPSTAHPVILE